MGSLTGVFVLEGPTLCAWVGTEAAPLEYDYINNNSCTEVDLISSLSEPLANQEVRIYPNPSNSLIYVDNTEQWQEYRIYDARGQMIQQNSLSGTAVDLQIDISDLPRGLYYLQLNNQQTKAAGRVIRM